MFSGLRVSLVTAAMLAGVGSAASAAEVVIPFDQLVYQDVLTLSAQRPQKDVLLPVADRWKVEKATLTVGWINSDRVNVDQSQIVAQLNGVAVGQSPLSSRTTISDLTVEIDPTTLNSGIHDISLLANMYAGDVQCSITSGLWTQVSPSRSQVVLQYQPRPIPASLTAALPFLFDAKQRPNQRIHLVVDQLDMDSLRAASLAAAAVTVRFDSLPIKFSVGDTLDPAVDNLVLGSREFVQKTMSTTLPVGQSVLAVAEVPGTTSHRGAVMLLGETPQALMQSVRGLAALRILPDVAAMVLDGVTLPEHSALSQPLMIRPQERITFSALRDGPLVLTAQKPTQDIAFRLPADFDSANGFDARLVLNMAYAPGVRSDSAVTVTLNGVFVGGVPLSNRNGERYRGYEMEIPLRVFQGGINHLQFQGELLPVERQACVFPDQQRLQAVLYPDSVVEVPNYHLAMTMPDLKSFGANGFPFSHMPAGQNSAIVLPGVLDFPTATATVNLVSQMTARIGVFPEYMAFTQNPADVADRNLLVVAPVPALPSPVAQAVGLDGPISTLSFLEASAQRNLEGTVDAFLLKLAEGAPQYVDYDYLGYTSLAALPDFASDHVVIAGGPSPYTAGQSVVVVATRSQADMPELDVLTQNAVWEKLGGGMTLIRTEVDPPVFETVLLNNRYEVGSSEATRNSVAALVYAYPTRFLLATLLGLVLLGWLLTRWHIRYRRTHTRSQAEK